MRRIKTQTLLDLKRRDHRTVGGNLNLFSIQEDAGGGLEFWHPNGAIIRRMIEDFLERRTCKKWL